MTPEEIVDEVTKLALSKVRDEEAKTALAVAFQLLRAHRDALEDLQARVEFLEECNRGE